MKIYVASSWRNEYFSGVVATLREHGYKVYDFTDSEGFSWKEVDPEWASWIEDISRYFDGLQHPLAERGFARDMMSLRDCDAVVYVMPCGVSASMEAGWAKGAGKFVVAYVPAIREPDLMLKMFDCITDDIFHVVDQLALYNEQQQDVSPAVILRAR